MDIIEQPVSVNDEPACRKSAMKKRNKRIKKNMKRYRDNPNLLPSLPTEFIFNNILNKLPLEYIHHKLRDVSSEWSDLVSTPDYIYQSFSNSSPKLILFSECFSISKFEFYEMNQGEIVRGESYCRFSGEIKSTCKGLILTADYVQNRRSMLKGDFHVFNPITGDKITLPNCRACCPHDFLCSCCLAFDPSSNVLKVVHIKDVEFGFEIWSLGIDTEWRSVPAPFTDACDVPFDVGEFDWPTAVSVKDTILHWNVKSDNFIISMAMNDEKARKTPLPIEESSNYNLIELDGYLSLMFNVSDYHIDIWILKDFERGEWIKKHSICTGSITYTNSRGPKPLLKGLKPELCLRNGEIILFHKRQSLYMYDTQLGTIKKLKLKYIYGQKLFVHFDSLISWEPHQLSTIFGPRKVVTC